MRSQLHLSRSSESSYTHNLCLFQQMERVETLTDSHSPSADHVMYSQRNTCLSKQWGQYSRTCCGCAANSPFLRGCVCFAGAGAPAKYTKTCTTTWGRRRRPTCTGVLPLLSQKSSQVRSSSRMGYSKITLINSTCETVGAILTYREHDFMGVSHAQLNVSIAPTV